MAPRYKNTDETSAPGGSARDVQREETDGANAAGERARVDSPDVSASGDEETPDGLNQLDEATRSATEDTPSGAVRRRRLPVFDRGEAPD
jgi:hypothetical protein